MCSPLQRWSPPLYENLDDLKRVMSRTELIQPDFLVKAFGTQSCEISMKYLHHLLRTNM